MYLFRRAFLTMSWTFRNVTLTAALASRYPYLSGIAYPYPDPYPFLPPIRHPRARPRRIRDY